jgi:ABC-type amino acid transport substrate-binding protein
MKRFVKLALVCAMTVLSATAFANGNKESAPAAATPINSAADLNGKTLGIMAPPLSKADLLAALKHDTGISFGDVQMFPTMNEALAALKAGRVDAAFYNLPYAQLLAKNDDTLGYIGLTNKVFGKITMVMLDSSAELLSKINTALASMKDDGTLAKLNTDYIANADTLSPAPVSIPVTSGERTVKVGISGDNPPFDYIAPDGKPAGYNTALMAKIAKRQGFNVEFLTIPLEAKFTALKSNRIDVFFFDPGTVRITGIVSTSVYYDGLNTAVLVRK